MNKTFAEYGRASLSAKRHRGNSRTCGASPAFTLIELLVVIAIISLLIALLTPSLSNARNRAHTVGCLSNIRQIGLGFAYYQRSFRGFFPHWRGPTPASNTSGTMWYDVIANQIDSDVTRVSASKPRLFRCPAQPSDAAWWLWSSFGYGYNFSYLGGWPDPSNSGKPRINISIVRNPSNTILVTDGSYQNHQYMTAPYGRPGLSNMFINRGRHETSGEKRDNVVWVDGHATTEKTDELQVNPAPDFAWWNIDK